MKKFLKWFAVVFCAMGLIAYTSCLFEVLTTADQNAKSTIPVFVSMDALMLFFLYLLLRKKKKTSQSLQANHSTEQLTNAPKSPIAAAVAPIVEKQEPNAVPRSQSVASTLPDVNIEIVREKTRRIPKEIFELLWFLNGPFQNYFGISDELEFDFAGTVIHIKSNLMGEPSAIDVDLPLAISVTSPAPLGYYPSYEKLDPQQRTAYLSWLADITIPIDIGYVFIFYYGLERHLFFGNSEAALATIFVLRKFHHNKSFLSYSEDALMLYALIHNNPSIMQNLDIQQLSSDLRLFATALSQHSLSAQDIMDTHRKFSFDNNRYIKGEPALFLSTLEAELLKRHDVPNFPISLADFQSAKATFTLALANYSLLPTQRFLSLPDIATTPRVHDAIHTLLSETHESVKLKLREARKKAAK